MTFGAPLFLIAALAGIIPVLLHMMNRQKAPEMRFSTLRFLRVSVQRTRRRKTVHDVLLLSLRIAALLLIAMGLARPTISHFGALLGRQAATAVVLVLDNSASMGTRDETGQRWDAATAASREILQQLGDRDQVALLMTCGPPRPELERLYQNQEVVSQALDACRISYELADIGARILHAKSLLAESDAPNKEIYVVTDMQKASWHSVLRRAADSIVLSPLPAKRNSRGEGKVRGRRSLSSARLNDEGSADTPDAINSTPIVLVDVHGTELPNVALRGLELHAAAPVADMPIRASVELAGNTSASQQRHVELHVDGKKLSVSPTLTVEAGTNAEHVFDFALSTPGLHRGEIRLASEDACSLDDRLFFALHLTPQIPVALVQAGRHEIPYLEDTYYLRRALRPTESGDWAIQVTTLSPDGLASDVLSRYAVVFCVNLPALDAAAARSLGAFVCGGGHVFWICGESVQPNLYNEMNRLSGGELLPLTLADVRGTSPAQPDGWHIGWLDPSHPALAPLVTPPSVYQSTNVYKHVTMESNDDSAARVLARLEDGQALLATRSSGQGTVSMLGTSGHVDWSNLPLRPLFMPLLLRMTFRLAGADAMQSQLVAGTPLGIEMGDPAQSIEIVRPSGETVRMERDPGAASRLRYSETHDVGIYQVRQLGRANQATTAYALNLDPRETDSAILDTHRLLEHFGPRVLVVCEDPLDVVATINRLRQGESVWEFFLMAVLFALVAETFVANCSVGYAARVP